MYSVNLNITKIEKIKNMLKDYYCTKKFTKLVVFVLRHFDKKLNPVIFIRGGVLDNTEELSQEEKEKIKKQLIFVECINFIICSIDNIVHPEEEEEKTNIYSKIIGRRTKEKLQESLIQFFENPKTIEELSSLIKNLKNKLIIGQEYKKEGDNKNVIINGNVDSQKERVYKNVINDGEGKVKIDGKNPVQNEEENKDIKQEKKDNKLEGENNLNLQKKEDVPKKKSEEDNNKEKEEVTSKEKNEVDINEKLQEDVNKEKEEKEEE